MSATPEMDMILFQTQSWASGLLTNSSGPHNLPIPATNPQSPSSKRPSLHLGSEARFPWGCRGSAAAGVHFFGPP